MIGQEETASFSNTNKDTNLGFSLPSRGEATSYTIQRKANIPSSQKYNRFKRFLDELRDLFLDNYKNSHSLEWSNTNPLLIIVDYGYFKCVGILVALGVG
jgi:hypothetical protein